MADAKTDVKVSKEDAKKDDTKTEVKVAATDAKTSSTKPYVCILGGCGFIGRNLVKYLLDNELCSKIRVCDKQMVRLSESMHAFEKLLLPALRTVVCLCFGVFMHMRLRTICSRSHLP
jgi:hypothetical protein